MKRDIMRILADWNLWWEQKKVPKSLLGRERGKSKELVDLLVEKGKKWTKEQPNIVYASTGRGIEADALVVSVHKDYADFVRFFQNFKRLGRIPRRFQNLFHKCKRKLINETLLVQFSSRRIPERSLTKDRENLCLSRPS